MARSRLARSASSFFLIAVGILAQTQMQSGPDDFRAVVPRTWIDSEIESVEVPLAKTAYSPKHILATSYYRIPARTIYKTYPVYALDRDPPGYLDWLKTQEPEIGFDTAKMKSKEDWIRAGEAVFDWPTAIQEFTARTLTRNPDWYRSVELPVTKDGIIAMYRYVVREKGKLEIGSLSCAHCHTLVMRDGAVVKGAQGNFPMGPSNAFVLHQRGDVEAARRRQLAFFGPLYNASDLSLEEIVARNAAIPAGVSPRSRTSDIYPVQIPDLIGVQERRYLDRTGLQLHRSAVDLMRYAALNVDCDGLASYNGFIPAAPDFKTRPAPETRARYSDEQLYALALYLYSLKPPPNPNRFDATAQRGQKVFEREGCPGCHTPPLYTNNKLTPAAGFVVPEEHRRIYDILPVSVGTDPNLALNTMRGTGYYKVPSLKGVWYRGAFEHSGSVATLEDWLDANRLKSNYVPSGFKGAGVTARPVLGHEFGLRLSPADKTALIAFLKTL